MRIPRTPVLLAVLVVLGVGACGDAEPLLTVDRADPARAGVASSDGVSMETALSSGLTMVMDGPTLVRRWETCEYRAAASGGTHPYTYVWEADGGSGTSYGYYWHGYAISAGMWVTVTATDANGLKGSKTMYVDTSPSAPDCYLGP
jgi:hypothetical protein